MDNLMGVNIISAHSILSGTTEGFHVNIDDISYLLKFKMNNLIQERNNPKILDQTEKDVVIKPLHEQHNYRK